MVPYYTILFDLGRPANMYYFRVQEIWIPPGMVWYQRKRTGEPLRAGAPTRKLCYTNTISKTEVTILLIVLANMCSLATHTTSFFAFHGTSSRTILRDVR